VSSAVLEGEGEPRETMERVNGQASANGDDV